jgi:hypothetical protein
MDFSRHEQTRRLAQVFKKLLTHAVAVFLMGRSEDRRGMVRRHEQRRPFAGEDLAANFGDPKCRAHEGLGRGRAEADDDLRRHDLDLREQPGLAGLDFAPARLLVQTRL